MAGMPDLSPEDCGLQGHLVPTSRCASGRSCGWSWTCWFRQSILRNEQGHSVEPVQESMVERGKIDSLKTKMGRVRGRNSDIEPFVQQPSWYEGTWDCFQNQHQRLGHVLAP